MKFNDTITPKIVTYMMLLIFASTIAALFVVVIPVENKDLFNAMIQTLLTLTVAAVMYYVGSSAGSKAKDDAKVDATPSAPITLPVSTTTSSTVVTKTEPVPEPVPTPPIPEAAPAPPVAPGGK